MTRLQKALVAAIFLAGFVLELNYYHLAFPWTVTLQRGSCTVRQRARRSLIQDQCGIPAASGHHAGERVNGFPLFGPGSCSPGCDVHGTSVVFYDCNNRVWTVRDRNSAEGSACVIPGR